MKWKRTATGARPPQPERAAKSAAVLALLLALAATASTRAQGPPVVTRGPYLQVGTPTGIIVRWRTDAPSDSVVRYGTNVNDLRWSATAQDLTTEHVVPLSGLSPDTRYYYSIGTEETTLAGGPDFRFVTAPAAPKPTRVWVIGDSGSASASYFGSHRVRDAYHQFAGARDTDVWLMLGDNAYYSGSDAEYQIAVFETYPELLRRTPVWSTIGNHETYSADLNRRFAYLDIFSLPTQGEAGGLASGTEHYYSFNYGNLHFICLDSEESNRDPGGPMLTWLRADLEANTNDWIIAYWHSPPYTKGSHNSDSYADSAGRLFHMRTNAVPILEEFDVDLVLCGHSHSYERSFLMCGHHGLSDTLTPAMLTDAGSGQPADTGAYLKPATGGPHGAVYIVAGSSGWATYLTGRHPAMHTTLLQLGSLVLDVDGSRLDARFLRETGAIDDHFTLIKGGTAAPLRVVVFRVANGQTILRWKSVSGKTYRVERAHSLEMPQWEQVGALATATGATTSWTNATPEGAKLFYRVAEWP